MAGKPVRARESASDSLSHSTQQGIDSDQEVVRGQATQVGIPHPFMSHGADAAWDLIGIANTAQHCCRHVAVLECGYKAIAFVRIVTKPVQQLRPSPF